MHDDQSGSEGQGPGFVGPWSPPGDEAAQPAEASRADSPSPDVTPGRGETAPPIMPPGVAGPPLPGGQAGGYGQPGGHTQPLGYTQPEAFGPPGDYRQPGGYGQPGGFAQPGGYANAGGPGQPGGYGQPSGYPPPGGYSQAGGYGGGGFGQGGYPPGYLPADYLQQPPPPRRGMGRGLLVYVLVAALAAGIGAGVVAAVENHSSTPVSQGAQNPGVNPNPGNNGPGNNGNAPNPGTGVSNAKAQSIASAVEPGVVDISSSLQYVGGNAEATGMVISPSGLVLTNNHVIDQTTGLTATVVTTGQKFTARWLGYDKADDVALIQLVGASGLRTVPLGNSSTVKTGENVVAIGNAQGRGGAVVVTGSITQLNQTITASDTLGGTETLHGMLQTNAEIVEGDSGGPLADEAGRVIGMNTAASSGSLGNQTSDVGFAIPINRALSIARQIRNGQASPTITIGPTGFLGVLVPSQRAASASRPAQQQQLQLGEQSSGLGVPGSNQCLASDQNAGVPQNIAPVSSGTLVLGSLCNTPSAAAGIVAGDVITAVGGHAVGSPNSLTAILQHYRPGTMVSVTWVDTSGVRHVSDLKLLQHPPY